MQSTSALYKQIFKIPTHEKEVYVDIAGDHYGENRIVSLTTSGGIFSTPDIGNCASRQIDLTLREPGEIPRSAKIKVFVRLVSGTLASEWIQKGEFFISTRKKDKRTGKLTIHGFDAMLRASDVWLTPDYDYENWPMSKTEAILDISRRMGVPVDSRTWGNLPSFLIDYPIDENGDLTMMDILEGIAVISAGNWIISDKGELLFLSLGDIPEETNHLVTEYGSAITLGGVRILV